MIGLGFHLSDSWVEESSLNGRENEISFIEEYGGGTPNASASYIVSNLKASLLPVF